MLLDDFATPLPGASAVQPHTGAGSSTVTQKLLEARTATKNDKESNAMIDFEQAAQKKADITIWSCLPDNGPDMTKHHDIPFCSESEKTGENREKSFTTFNVTYTDSTSSTLSQDECGDTMHELRDMLSGSGQPQTQGCSKNPPAAPAAPPAQPDSKDSKGSNVTPMTNVTIFPDYYSLQCVESAMKATGLTAARVTYHDFSRFTESDGDSDGPPGMTPSDSDSDGPSEKLLKESEKEAEELDSEAEKLDSSSDNSDSEVDIQAALSEMLRMVAQRRL